MELILASASPRRRELLSDIARFRVEASRYEERGGGKPQEMVKRFARGKAEEVFARYPNALVLGADTVVSFEKTVLGKPENAEDAKRMLRFLSGKTHSVFTGVCLISGKGVRERVVESKVTFLALSEGEIERYVASGAPLDKAGAYGIQDGAVVASYEGSYTNIVGLPVDEVKELLKEEGYYD